MRWMMPVESNGHTFHGGKQLNSCQSHSLCSTEFSSSWIDKCLLDDVMTSYLEIINNETSKAECLLTSDWAMKKTG